MNVRPSPLFRRELRELIRKGLKTETRRVMTKEHLKAWAIAGYERNVLGHPLCIVGAGRCRIRMPHGEPGCVWYLREPLVRSPSGHSLYSETGELARTPDGALIEWEWSPRQPLAATNMGRIFARTFLVLESVRVERLGAIDAVGAKREGVADVAEFRDLWETIHARWDPTLWVWVERFRPADPHEVEEAKDVIHAPPVFGARRRPNMKGART